MKQYSRLLGISLLALALLSVLSSIGLCNSVGPDLLTSRARAPRFGTCIATPPYEFVDGQCLYSGITADYVHLFEKILGVKFKRTRCTGRYRMFKAVELKDVDFIPLVERTPELQRKMDFIFPYIQQPTVVVTTAEASFGENVDSLRGKRIAIPAYSGVAQYLLKLFGNDIHLVEYDGNGTTVLESVLQGEADAAILDLTIASYFLDKKRFGEMKIAGFTDYIAVRGMAVRKNMPELKKQLLGAVQQIPSSKHAELHSKWLVTPKVPIWKDDRLIGGTLIVLGVGLALLALITGWNQSLKKTVKKRTLALEAVNTMLFQSLQASSEQALHGTCLELIHQTMGAKVVFLAVKQNDRLNMVTSFPEDYVTVLNQVSFPLENLCCNTAVQSTISVKTGNKGELPACFALRAFHTDNIDKFVVGVASNDNYSPEALSTFNTLVSTFGQVVRHKQAERALLEKDKQIIRVQRMESLGVMAGGIAHDFNNILGAIIANGEMIELFHEVEEESVGAKLQSILAAAYRGRDVVQQILNFARPNSDGVKPLRLDEVVFETEKMFRVSLPAKIEMELRVDKEAVVLANSTQISQVLMNLCMNSVQAIGDSKGTIRIFLKKEFTVPKHMFQGALSVSDSYILLSVEDDGPGMPPEVLEHVFDPFFTTKPPGEGTGLGLSIVAGIVSSYGGFVHVDSAVETGTRINIIFPSCDQSPDSLRKESGISTAQGDGKILFVDDEETVLLSYSEVLEQLGYTVQAQRCAEAALKLFSTSPESYSLVITDYNMPGLTGDMLARSILDIRPDIPVILCTGFSSRFDERKAEGLGLAALLKKPVSIRELADTVSRFISM
ncbi:ATP-binding protein [Halodesulfovibrio marinisediminis]|uniref:histidine kinase n=1 Tax=Halodesulfovibrio marinisediminis DSM 17456 TaxID=1121457 RepID=A0A1N6ECJ6_9BACT|nr:transporter substrate-binding domain-containing protein [Halodesulfovibrio marinisediminis]SIN80768.1 Response regulator receiver domain-containing protein [Halodesulfovibrio marinisediminis DSM 17456]